LRFANVSGLLSVNRFDHSGSEKSRPAWSGSLTGDRVPHFLRVACPWSVNRSVPMGQCSRSGFGRWIGRGLPITLTPVAMRKRKKPMMTNPAGPVVSGIRRVTRNPPSCEAKTSRAARDSWRVRHFGIVPLGLSPAQIPRRPHQPGSISRRQTQSGTRPMGQGGLSLAARHRSQRIRQVKTGT
jgi:hypothetical protein